LCNKNVDGVKYVPNPYAFTLYALHVS